MNIAESARIHPTAIVEEGARIGGNVRIGPYCVIGPEVALGDGSALEAHVAICGDTQIGPGAHIFPFASVGHAPQDLKFNGEHTVLRIGAGARIREHVTINPGTEGGGGETVIGDNCLFMVGAHIAHDCIVGSNVILANNATCAGHVEIGDFAVLGGLCAVHQFARIGAHAMIGGMSGVERDVIPYGSVLGNRAELAGLNLIGLKRRGFDRETIQAMRAAYREIFEAGEGDIQTRAAAVAEANSDVEPVVEMASFIQADSARKFCMPRA